MVTCRETMAQEGQYRSEGQSFITLISQPYGLLGLVILVLGLGIGIGLGLGLIAEVVGCIRNICGRILYRKLFGAPVPLAAGAGQVHSLSTDGLPRSHDQSPPEGTAP